MSDFAFSFFNLAFALLDEYIFLLSLIYSTNARSPQMRYCVILFNIGVASFENSLLVKFFLNPDHWPLGWRNCFLVLLHRFYLRFGFYERGMLIRDCPVPDALASSFQSILLSLLPFCLLIVMLP